MAKGDVLEIEGELGDFDYGGVLLRTADLMVETVAKGIVAPDVRNRINRITGETERSIKVRREGFFDPRQGLAMRNGIGPTWSVYADPSIIEHMPVLEYGYGGRNAVMRPSARSRKVKAAIRTLLRLNYNKEQRIQVRNEKRRKRK